MVEELWLDRPFLESLTTNELIKLADNQGIDIPPGLDRTIVIEELLETIEDAAENAERKTPLPLTEKHQGATAPLPKQYNINYIEVLIRDPLWAFAFWEINAHDREIHERSPDFGGYYLRAVSSPRIVNQDSFFIVQVGTGDSAWYLGFPPSGGSFKVELCVMRKDELAVLAVSKPFRLPKLLEPLENRDSAGAENSLGIKGTRAPVSGSPPDNPLLRLSGVDDYKILRDPLRSSRLPKRNGSNAAGVRGGQ
ncbi:MAG: DUF4912 domain-containing protein [Treponema sp.]|jgi:hypothetical protein|nr:DUF4912 domain-containing protein [Treponema sp.]